MKKFFLVLLGLCITTQVCGAAVSPLYKKSQKAKQEYEQSQIKCTDDKPLFVNGGCVACDEYDNWNDVVAIIGAEKCKNSFKCFGGYYCLNCPDDKPVLLSNGSCVPCGYKPISGPIYDVVRGCERCAGYVKLGTGCYKQCPDDKPVNTGDKCESCDAEVVGYAIDCEKCSNRYIFRKMCYKKCPDYRPLLMADGKCASCDTDGYSISGCEKCSNRKMIGNLCYKACPQDKPVLLKGGADGCKTCAEILAEYKDRYLDRIMVASGWKECSFEGKFEKPQYEQRPR